MFKENVFGVYVPDPPDQVNEDALPDNGDCEDNQRGINTGFSTKSKKPLYPQYKIDENKFKNPKRMY